MEISPFFFYFFAGLAIACSLMVILKKNPVASAFNLVLVFFSFAAIYVLLQAHLIAALQILVYTGAVMVLFVFVIMLLAADTPSTDFKRSGLGLRAGVAGLSLILLGFFIKVFRESDLQGYSNGFTPEVVDAAGGNTRVLSELMFSEYILPFELTSVLLLAVIVGTVAIAMRKKKAN